MKSNLKASHPATLALPASAPAAKAKLGDFSTNRRVLLLSGMAVVVGVISSLAAYGLPWLIVRNVKNYDGSWTEYGNLVGVPIEKA
jgi:hypothetical protein